MAGAPEKKVHACSRHARPGACIVLQDGMPSLPCSTVSQLASCICKLFNTLGQRTVFTVAETWGRQVTSRTSLNQSVQLLLNSIALKWV